MYFEILQCEYRPWREFSVMIINSLLYYNELHFLTPTQNNLGKSL